MNCNQPKKQPMATVCRVAQTLYSGAIAPNPIATLLTTMRLSTGHQLNWISIQERHRRSQTALPGSSKRPSLRCLPTRNTKVRRESIHTQTVSTLKAPDWIQPSSLSCPKQAKDVDENLIRLRSQVLDVANPLVSLLESTHRVVLTPKNAAETAQQALQLLGTHLSRPTPEGYTRSSPP